MRKRVVLPTPLGPTNPTRWPAYSSKPKSSKSGSASNARRNCEQLNSNMELLCGKDEICGRALRRAGRDSIARLQEQIDQGGIGDERPHLAKQPDRVLALFVKPALLSQQKNVA